jgi:hypothetical protein
VTAAPNQAGAQGITQEQAALRPSYQGAILMNLFRCVVAVATLALVGALSPAGVRDEVLVPGDPPLTQEMVDQFLERWQWYCNIRLSNHENEEYQRLLVALWEKKRKLGRQNLANAYKRDQQKYTDDLRLTGQEQEVNRARFRFQWMAMIRKDNEPVSRYATALYDEAYRPGGRNNPVVVEGDPPLTQGMLDLETAVVELLLDLRLTGEQRQKHRQLLLEAWKKADQDQRVKWVKSIGTWDKLPAWRNYGRSVQRALDQPNNLETWRKGDSDLDRWLVALYESSFRAGSARNPVLVDGDPHLTQLVVDRYGDFLQVILDTSMSGGFTIAQREVLQDYLVKDWKTMSADERTDLLADVKRWFDAAAKGNAAAKQCIRAIRPKLLAELYTGRDRPRYRWLLEVLAQDRQLVERHKKDMERVAEMQKIVDEMRHNIGPHGHWEYDGNTRRHRWVPDR